MVVPEIFGQIPTVAGWTLNPFVSDIWWVNPDLRGEFRGKSDHLLGKLLPITLGEYG